MSADPVTNGFEGPPAEEIVEDAARVFRENLAAAERVLAEAAKTAERVIRDGVGSLRARAEAYAGPSEEAIEDVQRYVVDRINERPVTAVLAGFGVGLILGLLLANRR